MRTEHDSLGDLAIPDDAYYGIQTQRAVENFPISGLVVHKAFIEAYIKVKLACARANMSLGVLDKTRGRAIVQAAEEALEGKFDNQFVVDVFQAGAGTSTNMNVNEVLANRALELLGKPRGDYESLSPNDDVNMSQSTNDSYPTAMRISALTQMESELFPAIAELHQAFRKKSQEFANLPKSARTHLQDAVPMMLGDEFGAWATMMHRHTRRLEGAMRDLVTVGIGGSAAGTGLNTPKGYQEAVVKELQAITGLQLEESKDLFESMQSMASFVHLMGGLKNLALDLFKISADLRLLSSGPMTGLAEIQLPAVQPGSSIMPGKVNPSILEMLSQVCLQIVGAEAVVSMASQAGQLELNVMMPVIQYNCTESIIILSAAIRVTAAKCVAGISADPERMFHYAETSSSIVTALAPEIGYLAAAEAAKESLKRRVTIRSIILEKNLMTEARLSELLDIEALARGR